VTEGLVKDKGKTHEKARPLFGIERQHGPIVFGPAIAVEAAAHSRRGRIKGTGVVSLDRERAVD
jgi:hypothetical protein